MADNNVQQTAQQTEEQTMQTQAKQYTVHQFIMAMVESYDHIETLNRMVAIQKMAEEAITVEMHPMEDVATFNARRELQLEIIAACQDMIAYDTDNMICGEY